MNWSIEKPSVREYEYRRERVQFAIYCVLIAYTEVYLHWISTWKGDDKPPSYRWLYLQLFPNNFLGSDVFEKIAVELYQSCNPLEVFKYSKFQKDFYVIIDEAQVLGTILIDKFMTTTPGKRDSSGLRPVLSPVLHSIKSATDRSPIVAGTGLTLLLEWKSIVSCMGVPSEFIFTDFPLLDEKQVEDLLKNLVVIQDEFLGFFRDRNVTTAIQWLVGRPRWVTEFITGAIVNNKTVAIYINEFIKWLVSENDVEGRTPYANIQRLSKMQQKVPITGTSISNPYDAALQDAFLLSNGYDILPRESPLMLEYGLGYSVPNFRFKTILKFEPIILETCRLIVEKDKGFSKEFMRSVSEDTSHLGTRFEIIAANVFLASFTAQPLEEHPLLSEMTLPACFQGHWRPKKEQKDLTGKVAWKTTTQEEFYSDHPEPIHFPDNFAGPDTIITLQKEHDQSPLRIFIQDKVRKKFDFKKALLTVDPSKLHTYNRGLESEKVYSGVGKKQKEYLDGLTGPVIRVIVSVLEKFDKDHVQLVSNLRNTQDLLIIIDPSNAHLVFNQDLWNFIKSCRFLD